LGEAGSDFADGGGFAHLVRPDDEEDFGVLLKEGGREGGRDGE